jgi:hypothetical protein
MGWKHVQAVLVVVLGFCCLASPAGGFAPRPPQSKNSPIDLVQIQLIVPAKVTIGKVFRVLDEVENQGTSIAMPTTTGFYLSLDNVLDEQRDVVVGGRRVPRIGANQSHSTVTPVTLKPDIPPGDYYFIAVADARHELEERYIDNNVRTVRVTVLADQKK